MGAGAEPLALVPVVYRGAASGTQRAVAGPQGAVWLVPDRGSVTSPVRWSDGGAARASWGPPREAAVQAARDGSGGMWAMTWTLTHEPFTFGRVERVVRLSAAGRVVVDAPFGAGTLWPGALASDASGRATLLGTLVGTLTTATGTLTAPEQARSEVVVRLGDDGRPAWATALGREAGTARHLAVAPDGGAVASSMTETGVSMLTALDASGSVRWRRLLEAPLVSFPLASVTGLASDGAGGVLLVGALDTPEPHPFAAHRTDAYGVARIDAAGQLSWVRGIARQPELVGDGAGAALVVTEVESGAFVVAEVDAAGTVKRRLSVTLPDACTGDAVRTTTSAALSPTHLTVAVTCQPHDETPTASRPRGNPLVLVGSRARR